MFIPQEYETSTIPDGANDWQIFRYAASDDHYGSRDHEIMQGWHGVYDLATGYFDCFNLDDLPNRTIYLAHIEQILSEGYFHDSTRAIITSFTIYDVPTRFYTDINIVLEISAAGFFNPSILEVRPFKIPIQDQREGSVLTIYFCRWILCIGWIILVLITMMKKGSV